MGAEHVDLFRADGGIMETASFRGNFFDCFQCFVDLSGAENEIQMRQFIQQFFSESLCHTPHNTDYQLRFAEFQFPHIAYFSFGFAFGSIPDAAGVEEQYIGIFFDITEGVSGFYK